MVTATFYELPFPPLSFSQFIVVTIHNSQLKFCEIHKLFIANVYSITHTNF